MTKENKNEELLEKLLTEIKRRPSSNQPCGSQWTYGGDDWYCNFPVTLDGGWLQEVTVIGHRPNPGVDTSILNPNIIIYPDNTSVNNIDLEWLQNYINNSSNNRNHNADGYGGYDYAGGHGGSGAYGGSGDNYPWDDDRDNADYNYDYDSNQNYDEQVISQGYINANLIAESLENNTTLTFKQSSTGDWAAFSFQTVAGYASIIDDLKTYIKTDIGIIKGLGTLGQITGTVNTFIGLLDGEATTADWLNAGSTLCGLVAELVPMGSVPTAVCHIALDGLSLVLGIAATHFEIQDKENRNYY